MVFGHVESFAVSFESFETVSAFLLQELLQEMIKRRNSCRFCTDVSSVASFVEKLDFASFAEVLQLF